MTAQLIIRFTKMSAKSKMKIIIQGKNQIKTKRMMVHEVEKDP